MAIESHSECSPWSCIEGLNVLECAPLVLKLRAPSEGFCSQLANLSSWLFLIYELHRFCCSFSWFILSSFSPQIEHALLCNEIIMSSLPFFLYTRPHFPLVFLLSFVLFFLSNFKAVILTRCPVLDAVL